MIIVLEGLTDKNPASKVKYGGNIIDGMTGNSNFASPDMVARVAALDTATTDLKKANDKGVVSDIAVRENEFDNSVKAIVFAVQALILGKADDQAKAIVESANLGTKKQGKPIFADLAAHQGTVAKSVELRKKVTTRNKRVAYVWQITSTPTDESSWTICKISTVAKVTILNLLSGKRYYFRVAIIMGEEMGEFSDATSILVN